MKPSLICLLPVYLLLHGCSAPTHLRATALVQNAHNYTVECDDSAISKIYKNNDITIMASAYGLVTGKRVYYILANKAGVWTTYYYTYSAYDSHVPGMTNVGVAQGNVADGILSYILKKQIFELGGQESVPRCSANVLDGSTWYLFIGTPKKIIERDFTNPDFYNQYCPVYNRTVFIQAFEKIASLFAQNR